ncbi:hypothetical protein NXS19_013829 [Fusarium pseudograminearum]|nr:hypothetical protein NXS19_013829 [Fusarium pseudograminearum]
MHLSQDGQPVYGLVKTVLQSSAGTALKWLLGLLVVIRLATRALRSWRRRRLARANFCEPITRVPQRDPILGIDILQAELEKVERQTYLESFRERYDRYGRTWAYKTLNKLTINTIEPENIEYVLKTGYHCFDLGQNRMDVIEPSIEAGLLTLNGATWHNARTMTQPGFNRKIMHRVPFETYFQNFIRHIPEDVTTPVDLAPLFGRFTLDSSWDLIFGKAIDALGFPTGSQQAVEVEDALSCILARTYDCMTRGHMAVWWPRKGHRDGLKKMHDMIDREISDALNRNASSSTEDPQCMIDLFTSAQAQEKFNSEHSGGTETLKRMIRVQLSHIVLAGRDTTAILLSNLFLELSKNPRVWQKLVDEVAPLEGQIPIVSKLGSFQYLRHCINEALRLYPPAPLNNRRATKDVVLPRGGGPQGDSPILVREGDEVTFHLHTLNRREEYFGPDVDEFVPERWEHINPDWSFVPFSAGRRTCIGRQFALDEASYVMVRLLQTFEEVNQHGNKPWVEELRILASNSNGTVVTMKRKAII